MANQTISIVTVGKLCEILQAGPGQILAAAQTAGVRAVLIVNGGQSTYFDETDIPRIKAALKAA